MVRKRHMLILLLLLLAGIGVCYGRSVSGTQVMLTVEDGREPYLTVRSQETVNIITLWTDEDTGLGYFFLPSFVSVREVSVSVEEGCTLRIGEKIFGGGVRNASPVAGEGSVSVYHGRCCRHAESLSGCIRQFSECSGGVCQYGKRTDGVSA